MTTYFQFLKLLHRTSLEMVAADIHPDALFEHGSFIPRDPWHYRVVQRSYSRGPDRYLSDWLPMEHEGTFTALKHHLRHKRNIKIHFRLPHPQHRVAEASLPSAIPLPSEPPISLKPTMPAAAAPVDFSIWEQSNYPPVIVDSADLRRMMVKQQLQATVRFGTAPVVEHMDIWGNEKGANSRTKK